MVIKKLPLEKDIEAKFVREAKKLGCLCRKLNGMGARDWPDRLVLVPGGAILLIEFKRLGATLRPSQEAWHEDAKAIGQEPYVFDNWEQPLALVERKLR